MSRVIVVIDANYKGTPGEFGDQLLKLIPNNIPCTEVNSLTSKPWKPFSGEQAEELNRLRRVLRLSNRFIAKGFTMQHMAKMEPKDWHAVTADLNMSDASPTTRQAVIAAMRDAGVL